MKCHSGDCPAEATGAVTLQIPFRDRAIAPVALCWSLELCDSCFAKISADDLIVPDPLGRYPVKAIAVIHARYRGIDPAALDFEHAFVTRLHYNSTEWRILNSTGAAGTSAGASPA